MDKIIKIPLLIFVLLCLLSSAHAQWIDRGTYSELNINIPDIKYLKISSDSSSVFIQKADTLKKISLADGEIIEEKYLDSLASFGIVAVSHDDKYYAYPAEYKLMIRVYDCNTDSLLSLIDHINDEDDIELFGYGTYNTLLYFQPDNNNLFIACNYSLYYGYGDSHTGNINCYDPLTGGKLYGIIGNAGIIKICYSSGTNYIAFKYYKSFVRFNRYSDMEEGLYLHDFKTNNNDKISYKNELSYKDDVLEKDYREINLLAFSPDSRYLSVCNDNNRITTWSLDSRQITYEYTLEGSHISNMIYAKQSNFLVIGTGNGKIIFLDAHYRNIINTLSFNSLYAVNTINYINDTTILVHCSDGYLRKFSTSEFINYKQDLSENNKIQCYPNPAQHILTFEYYLEETGNISIKIHNYLGQMIMNVINEGQSEGIHEQEIDISSLPTGLCYISLTVNSKVYASKFIKTE